ncbi:MAG: rifampicin phosphotransferase [Thermomicrobiales bacterium]|nr:rifampicin phosphotransferase [Thermomicrobiales bacterium]
MVVAPVMDAPAFPLTWQDPTEAEVTWLRDPMHFPRPLSPLFRSVWGPAFEFGFSTAARELSMPVLGVRVRFHNGYEYEHHDIAEPASEDEAREMGARTEAAMREAIGRQMDRWQGEFLPRLLKTRDRLRTVDVAQASPTQVVALIDEVDEIAREDWLIHFRIAFPMMLAMELYDEFYAELFGSDAANAHALLVGQSSKSVAAGIGLSQLATYARENGLKDAVLSQPAEEVLASIEGTKEGGVLANKIRTYLDEFGLRQDLFDFITPTWQEDPSIAIATIQAYLQSGHDTAAEHEASVRKAEAALTTAREGLVGYPEPVRGQFEGMVQAARVAYFLQEEHNFYIDQQGIALMRLFFLRLGERLVSEGKLDRPDDVFMLTRDEIKATVSEDFNARAAAAAGWAELDRQRALTAPPFVGAPPAGPPPTDNPMLRANVRFFGGPPQQADAPNQLKGNAGSRGTARGVARVALTLDDAKWLQPGEILVTLTTMPAWTPLFGTAAAVVTETGGPLSHCAIVAREYAIPAVVGAFGATRAIQTGQTILVDGDRGLVTLE